MPTIQPLSKSHLKYFRSLQQKKYRNLNKVFLIEGEKMVKEIFHVQNSHLEVIRVLAIDEFYKENPGFPSKFNCFEISKGDLNKISGMSSPDKVLMELKMPEYSVDSGWTEEFNIYLESIRDPGNLGTIIRTADWFGFKKVFCSPDSVDVYNPKVIQSSMGSIARVKVIYLPIEEVFKLTTNENSFQNIGTVLGGENIYNFIFPKKGMLFFGNESNGLSTIIQKNCQKAIGIPGATIENGPESLNLGISVGIVLSELSRQKLLKMKI
ncbi:MAG: RNA methyltransferase [Bacteroidales bacterium]|nr:RNA methyltransferase [Bacteroidales bacterium]MCF8390578.1 RNA methyltransferase [Bacteroidales bacterium]